MQDSSSAGRVAGALRRWVDTHEAGDRLPSTRALSREHSVGPVTVQRAVEALVAEGLVETRPGTGNFVAARATGRRREVAWQSAALGPSRPKVDEHIGSGIRSVPTDTVPLHSGYPTPELQAASLVTSALTKAAKDPRALAPAPTNGLPGLRALIAREVGRGGSAGISEDDVVITAGGQSALVAAFRALTRPGDVVVMESPTFWGAIAAATEAGLQIAPVATGPDGIDPDDLADALEAHRAKVFYAQPTHANPTGRSWSREVRAAVLEVARERSVFVVEDDWGRDLALVKDPMPPLVQGDLDGHVVHIRSLTKSMTPSMRVAGLIAKGPALQRIRASRWAVDLYVPSVLQLAAADVLSRPGWPRHLTRLRQSLIAREQTLREAVTEHAPSLELQDRPLGGLFLWCALPDGCDPVDITALCLQAGVAVSPGNEWFPAEADRPYLRLSFAACSVDAFAPAAQVLQRVVAAG